MMKMKFSDVLNRIKHVFFSPAEPKKLQPPQQDRQPHDAKIREDEVFPKTFYDHDQDNKP
jgi:hypothetical protein